MDRHHHQPEKIVFASLQKYYITFETFGPGQTNAIPSECNAITFRNLGSDTVYINNIVPLIQDDFISLPGDIDELDVSQYFYKFAGAAGKTQLLLVVRKTFVDNKK